MHEGRTENYTNVNRLFLPNACKTSYKTEGCTYFSTVDMLNEFLYILDQTSKLVAFIILVNQDLHAN